MSNRTVEISPGIYIIRVYDYNTGSNIPKKIVINKPTTVNSDLALEQYLSQEDLDTLRCDKAYGVGGG